MEEGTEVKVNEPVAVMCELRESLEKVAKAGSRVDDLLKDHDKLRKLTWQSYLKESHDTAQGCS